jgi:hypothetical protein
VSARWDGPPAAHRPAVLEDAGPRCTVLLVVALLFLASVLAATL